MNRSVIRINDRERLDDFQPKGNIYDIMKSLKFNMVFIAKIDQFFLLFSLLRIALMIYFIVSFYLCENSLIVCKKLVAKSLPCWFLLRFRS